MKTMEIISLVLNFLLSSGIVGVLIFYSSKKRKAAAEASSAELGAREQEFAIQRENIEFLSSQLQEAWSEVEKLQGLINTKRGNIIALITKTKQLEIDIIESQSAERRAEMAACHRVECMERISKVA